MDEQFADGRAADRAESRDRAVDRELRVTGSAQIPGHRGRPDSPEQLEHHVELAVGRAFERTHAEAAGRRTDVVPRPEHARPPGDHRTDDALRTEVASET